MSELSDKLAQSLNSLRFVEVVESSQTGSAVQILCRVKPHFGVQWAALAEVVLRAAAKRENTPDFWHSHIARVYMLRDNKFVYGWTFMIASQEPEKSVDTVCKIITRFNKADEGAAQPQVPVAPPDTDDEEYDPQDDLYAEEDDDDERYTDPEGPLPKGAVPEADEKGNPIVPRQHRVESVPIAGLSPNKDMNAPNKKGKGVWGIGSQKMKPFRPPVRG